MIGTVSLVVEAGVGVVLDGNFNTERHMAPVRKFIAATGLLVAEVCLWGDPDELRRRFAVDCHPPRPLSSPTENRKGRLLLVYGIVMVLRRLPA